MAKAKNNESEQEDSFMKTSVTVMPTKWKKMKYIQLVEGSTIQDVLDEALTLRIKQFEQKKRRNKNLISSRYTAVDLAVGECWGVVRFGMVWRGIAGYGNVWKRDILKCPFYFAHS